MMAAGDRRNPRRSAPILLGERAQRPARRELMTGSSWDRCLRQGDEKVKAVREMFDAIAPRYDLVNRVMTFRLDVRWRRRAVWPLSLPPAGSVVLDLASGTGDLCVDLAAAGHRPGLDRPQPRACSQPTAAEPRGCRPTSCACPSPTGGIDGVTCGFALRNLVDLPAFFAELARVVRPGGRIALLDVGRPDQPPRPGRQRRVLRQGRAQDRRPALGPGGLPLPAPQRRLPAATRRAGRRAADGRLPRRPPPPLTLGVSSAAHRHAVVMRAVSRRADDATRRLDLNDIARDDGFLFVRDGVGFAGRGVAARVPVDDARRSSCATIDHDDQTGYLGSEAGGDDRRPDPVLGPSAGCRSLPGAPGEAVIPAVVVVKAADGRLLGHVDRRRRRGAGRRPAPPRPTADRYTIAPVTPIDTYLDAVATVRDAVRDGRLVKAVHRARRSR